MSSLDNFAAEYYLARYPQRKLKERKKTNAQWKDKQRPFQLEPCTVAVPYIGDFHILWMIVKDFPQNLSMGYNTAIIIPTILCTIN